ncbi:unnamed protein product [Arctogadus glacialis]
MCHQEQLQQSGSAEEEEEEEEEEEVGVEEEEEEVEEEEEEEQANAWCSNRLPPTPPHTMMGPQQALAEGAGISTYMVLHRKIFSV